MVTLTIDGKKIEAAEQTSIIRAAQQAGIFIPHLCEHDHLTPHGGCRLCVVEVEGINTLQTSCTYKVQEGMVVHTETPKVREARRFVLSLIFSERNHFCMVCSKTNGNCELQNAAYHENMTHWDISPSWDEYALDTSHPWIVWDHNRCILCQRCVRACTELAGRHVIVPQNRGAALTLTADYGILWGESSCIKCGTCLQVCPTGAMTERRNVSMEYSVKLEDVPGICVECGLGCQTNLYTRSNQLVRINGDWGGKLNHGMLCELGRFQALANLSLERVTSPMLRVEGTWTPIKDQQAAQLLLKQLSTNSAVAIISARLPAEALHLFLQVFTHLGCEIVTSSETSGDSYGEVLAVINDPKLAVVEPEMFTKRGKANSQMAKRMGLTSPTEIAGKAVFVMLGDDLDLIRLVDDVRNSEFLAVECAYLEQVPPTASLVFPAVSWLEEGGHYLSLAGELQENQCHLSPPAGINSHAVFLNELAHIAGLTIDADWQTIL